MSDLVKRLRESAVELMEGDGLIEDVRDLLHAADRIEQLEPYKDELEKIAEDLGEAEDPFAAWEAVEALKAELAAEKALADALWRLIVNVGDGEVFASYRKARGL